jgi:hypothetical protein
LVDKSFYFILRQACVIVLYMRSSGAKYILEGLF